MSSGLDAKTSLYLCSIAFTVRTCSGVKSFAITTSLIVHCFGSLSVPPFLSMYRFMAFSDMKH